MRDMPPGTRTKVYGPQYMSESFSVSGEVANPRSFSYDELLCRPRVTVEGFVILCGSGKVKDSPRTLSGVLLRDILDEASVRLDEHEDPNLTYIVATGNDGYRALFSWHELWNGPAGDGVIVVLEKDGKPLGEGEGRLCLVSTKDERPGPRRVRYLSSVEVRKI